MTKKFVAVMLAIWLPLFSGNALAASIAMQAMTGGHHSGVVQPDASVPHCATMQQHTGQAQPEANPGTSPGESCGTCHFACCGYLAAATLEVTEVQPVVRLYASPPTQFQSIAPIPLDHPPLVRI